MNSDPASRPASSFVEPATSVDARYVDARCHFGISWPAVFAGVVAAFALEVLFVFLGSAFSFAVFTPLTDANPVKNAATGAMVLEGVAAVIALWFGGWVTGRFTPARFNATACLHGFVVWCTATAVGVCLMSSGAAWAVGGLSKIVGGGISMMGKPAAGVAEHAAAEAKGALQRSSDTVSSFANEAASNPQAGSSPGVAIKAKRDVGLALGRLFDPSQKTNMADNHAAAVKVLTDDAGMSQADAEKTVNDWTDEYNRLQEEISKAKNEAEAKAREEANEASKTLAVLSLCAFFAFGLGALAATLGSRHGAETARRCEARIVAP